MDVFNFSYQAAPYEWCVTVGLGTDADRYDGCNYVKTTYWQKGVAGKCESWRIDDAKLGKHMSYAMYTAFYRVALNNGEPIQTYDFDAGVLDIEVCEEEVKEMMGKITACRTCDYISLWREVKASLAAAIVIISNFDWIYYQKESCKLTDNSSNVIEYLIYALTFISKQREDCSAFSQDILNRIHQYRCIYPSNYAIKICMGVCPVSRKISTNNLESFDDCFNRVLSDEGELWVPVLWTIIFIVIIFFIIWLIIKLAESTAYTARPDYVLKM